MLLLRHLLSQTLKLLIEIILQLIRNLSNDPGMVNFWSLEDLWRQLLLLVVEGGRCIVKERNVLLLGWRCHEWVLRLGGWSSGYGTALNWHTVLVDDLCLQSLISLLLRSSLLFGQSRILLQEGVTFCISRSLLLLVAGFEFVPLLFQTGLFKILLELLALDCLFFSLL